MTNKSADRNAEAPVQPKRTVKPVTIAEVAKAIGENNKARALFAHLIIELEHIAREGRVAVELGESLAPHHEAFLANKRERAKVKRSIAKTAKLIARYERQRAKRIKAQG
jgi:hypothetical protein